MVLAFTTALVAICGCASGEKPPGNSASTFEVTPAVRYAYDPLGRLVQAASRDGTGVQYNYDAVGNITSVRRLETGIGRFISEDPIGWASGQTNNYAYVGGDPINFIDPFGLDAHQNTEDFLAGFGDNLLLGLGPVLRDWLGINGVNPSSGWYMAGDVVGTVGGLLLGRPGGGRGGGRPRYVPTGPDGRPLPLPRGPNGQLAPSSMYPHTQIGWQERRRGGYVQTRELGPNGQPVKQVDWTDHGRPAQHTDPHVHDYVPNPTGGTPQHGPAMPARPGEL